ncbi:MAG TPA: N-acyl homoserine lactonase family protein [Solirubrobacteraceae bacterium]|nr:N-acyl homoserine lactonase family protein [Solirubrobacteraceae bacterium]
MPVAAATKRARLPLRGGVEDAGVVVHPLLVARMLAMPHFLQRPSGPLSTLRGLGILTPRSRFTPVPIPAYLVEHPGAGPVLIDTGLPAVVAREGAGALGRAAAIAYRVEMEPQWAVVEQLRARGVDPIDVKVIVMTHLHYDHASAVGDFPQATFVVDADEWRAARSGGFTSGYAPKLFDHPFDWREIDFDDPRVASFATFGRTVDLFGDGSIRLLSTPGHSKGHMSVLLRLESGRELLLTGDAAFARRTIDEELVPVLVDDVHRYRRSLREIRRYVEQTPSAEVICGHDAERWPDVRDRYA